VSEPVKNPISGSKTLQNTFFLLGIAVFFTLICMYAKTVIVTITASFIFSVILDSPVNWLERLRIPRWISVTTVIIVTLVLLVSMTGLMFVRTQDLITDLPKYQTKIEKVIQDIERKIKRLERATEAIIPQTEQSGPAVREVKIQDNRNWNSILLYLASVLSHVFLVPFIVFFILIARDDLKDKTANIFGKENRASTLEAIHQIQKQLIGFLAGNFIAVIVLWLITILGFWALGVDYAVLNAAIFAVLNIIPVIGPVLGLIPPVLLVFLETESLLTPGLVIGYGLLTHLIYANIFLPKMVGSRVRLNPTAIMIAMVYWGWLWGVTGLILAIPLVATLKTICDHVEPWKPFGELMG